MLCDMNNFVFRFEFDLADRLRKSLRVSGVSVGSMARSLGVSRNTVSNWINGRGRPSDAQLTVWAAVTDAPGSWLESGEPPSKVEDGSTVYRIHTSGPKANRRDLAELGGAAAEAGLDDSYNFARISTTAQPTTPVPSAERTIRTA